MKIGAISPSFLHDDAVSHVSWNAGWHAQDLAHLIILPIINERKVADRRRRRCCQ